MDAAIGPFNLQGRFQKSLSNAKGREIILRNGTGSVNPLLECAHHTPLRLGWAGVNGGLARFPPPHLVQPHRVSRSLR